ncbi:MAG TPA: hypothetical protein VNA27_10730 [Rubrobacteraceae bacterium]|nr:hypothetical protein [Rubrobacteraceae bacterium]
MAVLPARDSSSVPGGDENRFDELLGRLEDLRSAVVVLEATGGFERPAAAALVATRHIYRITPFYERLLASGEPKKVGLWWRA